MQLNQILGRFQSLSENCLMYLHLEQRVRCFLFLAPLFKGAKFNVGNSDALETDVEVERLETELKQIEDVLQGLFYYVAYSNFIHTFQDLFSRKNTDSFLKDLVNNCALF